MKKCILSFIFISSFVTFGWAWAPQTVGSGTHAAMARAILTKCNPEILAAFTRTGWDLEKVIKYADNCDENPIVPGDFPYSEKETFPGWDAIGDWNAFNNAFLTYAKAGEKKMDNGFWKDLLGNTVYPTLADISSPIWAPNHIFQEPTYYYGEKLFGVFLHKIADCSVPTNHCPACGACNKSQIDEASFETMALGDNPLTEVTLERYSIYSTGNEATDWNNYCSKFRDDMLAYGQEFCNHITETWYAGTTSSWISYRCFKADYKLANFVVLKYLISTKEYNSSRLISTTTLPGKATNIAVSANEHLFHLGIYGDSKGNEIYKWNGSGWNFANGKAISIAVEPNGTPWHVNGLNEIYRWNGSSWTRIPGKAWKIAIGADGSIFHLGVYGNSNGYEMYRWNNGSWVQYPGNAISIAVDPAGNPWHCNSSMQIYRWTGSNWASVSGKARELAISKDGTVFHIGAYPADGSGYQIFMWNGSGWKQIPGSATKLAAGPLDGLGVATLYYINYSTAIYKSKIQTATAPSNQTGLFPDPNKWYKIVTKSNSTLCLDINNTTPLYDRSNISVLTYTGGTNEQWKIQYNNDGSITLVSRANQSLAADISLDNGPITYGSNVYAFTNNGLPNQKWKINNISGTDYMLSSIGNPNYYLNANNYPSLISGSNVQVWTNGGGQSNEVWQFVEVQ